ncbi:hypothetical protein [Floridanema aerugineum]|jgi:hypothetical protein|uniref:Uncharacterized protein n=1 Tax=Floridaenema aerugineum BLCC-F46 TaxID=3153654 RepID=A0ABV4XG51_9CYAN
MLQCWLSTVASFGFGSLYLQNLKVGSTLLDLEFQRSGNTTSCRVAKKRGNLRVVIEA